MKLHDVINKSMLLSHKEIFKVLNRIFKYENVHFTYDMFMTSTPLYSVNFKNPFNEQYEEWIESLPIKTVIPDFMIENFTTLRREDTKISNDFLKIFLVRIFILNLVFIIRKNQSLYLNPLKEYQYTVDTINNRKNLEYFFKNYFKRKVVIFENIPERYSNSNQFKLGHNSIKSKMTDHTPSLGTHVFTSLNKYSVRIDIDFGELKKLEECVWALTHTKLIVLRSNTHADNPQKRYLYSLVFVGKQLKEISAIFSNGVAYAKYHSTSRR